MRITNTVLQGVLVEDKAVEGGLDLTFRHVSVVNGSHYDPLIHNQASKFLSPIELTRAKGIDNGGSVRFEDCSVADDRNRSFFSTGSKSHETRGNLSDVRGSFDVTNPFGCFASVGPISAESDVQIIATSCNKADRDRQRQGLQAHDAATAPAGSDSAGSAGSPRRAVSWWSSPSTPDDVRGLLAFAQQHRAIVTTVILECGVVTCLRPAGAVASENCLNNGGLGGTIAGNMSAACRQAIPALTKLGVRSEIWLGQDDSPTSAAYLFAHADATAHALLDLARAYPGLRGFNLDLEGGTPVPAAGVAQYGHFLSVVTRKLNDPPAGLQPLRFSADVGCLQRNWTAPSSLDTDCAALARSGVNKVMNMETYNALSYSMWARTLLAPALRDVPLDVLGVGLGCWVNDETNHSWNTKAVSAEQRVCLLMNVSVNEIDMFILRQRPGIPKTLEYPEDFWIPVLERYMGGGGCDAQTPPQLPSCPSGAWSSCDETGACHWVPGKFNSGNFGCCTRRANATCDERALHPPPPLCYYAMPEPN